SIAIPNSVTRIESYTFSGCTSLQSIEIPNSVTSIEYDAFSGCTSLQSIEIPNSVTSIGYQAFSNCTSLQSIAIPNSVTRIESYTFSGCTSLQSIEIPNSVTSIEYDAFSGCTSLQSIAIPNSVTSIEYEAFENCTSLKSINLSENLETIRFGTFADCQSLSSLAIPGSVSEIEQFENGVYTFKNCNNLKYLVLEYNTNRLDFGVSYYGKPAIKDWTNTLEKIYIDRDLSDDITYLNSLKELIIGENSTKICVKIDNADKLTKIFSYAAIPPTISYATTHQYMNLEVVVPIGSLDTYKIANVWRNFWNIREMTEEEAGIEDVATDNIKKEVARYNLQGQQVTDDYKGLVFIKYSDGSSRKVINK
ncbi:MAG: leucine-rich repeat domain-containing protein, partial [Duncaniella sp.]|nr:leucine-rich repeat domain-containing protein [Duncaniella sp.]